MERSTALKSLVRRVDPFGVDSGNLMRITHVTWGYYPELKGCGPVIYLHGLALAQRRAGHHVTIVCASDRTIPDGSAYSTLTEEVDGLPYVHLCNRPAFLTDFWNPGREAHDPAGARAFDAAFAESRPDMVHIHNFAGLSFDIVAAARRTGAKVFSSLHNYAPLCSRNDLFFADTQICEGPLVRSCSRCLGTMLGEPAYQKRYVAGVEALNACDLNLAVSRRVAEIYGNLGVQRERLAVEHIGTTTGEHLWQTVGAQRVARAAIEPDDSSERPLELIFFGNVSLARKGAMTFLNALAQLTSPMKVRARIFGGIGTQRAQIEAFLSSCDPRVRSIVTFHESFVQEDLGEVLAASDAAVLTPRWDDNGPQTVLEALAAGLPVLGTRVGGIPDVVRHEVNGILVTEGDTRSLATAVDSLAADRLRLERLRAAIKPPRTMREHAQTLDGLYAAALAPAAPPRRAHV